uniref:Uncharacterized protein n=1 Tax=Klebsiella phage HenuGS TaxID=3350566 RepID=A0AB74UKX8_9CAUD
MRKPCTSRLVWTGATACTSSPRCTRRVLICRRLCWNSVEVNLLEREGCSGSKCTSPLALVMTKPYSKTAQIGLIKIWQLSAQLQRIHLIRTLLSRPIHRGVSWQQCSTWWLLWILRAQKSTYPELRLLWTLQTQVGSISQRS